MFNSCLWLPNTCCAQNPKQNVITTLESAFLASVKIVVDNAIAVKGPSEFARGPNNRIIHLKKIKTVTYRRVGVGVIASTDGIIITNAHIVKGGGRIKIIFSDKTETTAQPVWMNISDDIAFLKINQSRNFSRISFTNSNNAKTQNDIYTIGSSKFIKGQMTRGKITGIGRTKSNPKEIVILQTSLSIYKGDSGSPLLTKDGTLMGMLSAKQTTSPYYSVAIPSNIIAKHLLNYLATIRDSH